MNRDLLNYEKKYKSLGYNNMAGVDEVGRGSLFGDVVASAVIMPLEESEIIEGVNDSKKITEKNRIILYEKIIEKCICYKTSFIRPSVIDEVNIYNATKMAMKNAIECLNIKPEFIFIDAMKLDIDIENLAIIKGDSKSYSIACASIIAKVERDEFIKKLSIKYPKYGLEKNKGYSTKEHLKALEEFGETDYHRKSFAPIKYKYNNDLFSSKE